MRLISLTALLFLFYCAKTNASSEWCYEDPECGPSHWAGACKSGKSQSPIELNSSLEKEAPKEKKKIRFDKQYLQEYPQFYITNNGHSVQIQLQSEAKSNLLFDGDGLRGSYVFAQAHFHWGSTDSVGSEHTIDGKRFPLELHLVHYSDRYDSLSAALQDNNRRALAVVAVFFEVTLRDNPAMESIIEAIPRVQEASHSLKMVPVQGRLNLTDLLPKVNLNLFRYEGSLTTPNCAEKVVWTIFQVPVGISENQLSAFRTLKDVHGKAMVNNFRPVQAIARRIIKFFKVDALEVKVDDTANNEIYDDYETSTDTETHGIDHEEEAELHNNNISATAGGSGSKPSGQHNGSSAIFKASAVLVILLLTVPFILRKL